MQGVSDITGLNPADIREVSERTGVIIERDESQSSPEETTESIEQSMTHSFELAENG